MPCDRVTTIGLDVGKLDTDVLAEGLRADGYQIQRAEGRVWFAKGASRGVYRRDTGTITTEEGNERLANDVKQSYTMALVQRRAVKGGWKIQRNGKRLALQKR